MEQLLQKSKCSIFHSIFKYRIFPNTGYFPIQDISQYRIFPNTGYFPIQDISQYRIFPNTGYFPIQDIFQYRKFQRRYKGVKGNIHVGYMTRENPAICLYKSLCPTANRSKLAYKLILHENHEFQQLFCFVC